MLSLIVALVLITIYNYKHQKILERLLQYKETKHYLVGYVYLIYLLVIFKEIVGFPSLSNWQRILNVQGTIFNPNISIIPFQYGILYSDYLNILLFMPLGFIIPLLWLKFDQLKPTIIYGFSVSLIIEIGQLFTRFRATDINDLIMNTIGTLLGWLCYKLFSSLLLKKIQPIYLFQSKRFFSLEPYIYIVIVLFSIFVS